MKRGAGRLKKENESINHTKKVISGKWLGEIPEKEKGRLVPMLKLRGGKKRRGRGGGGGKN